MLASIVICTVTVGSRSNDSHCPLISCVELFLLCLDHPIFIKRVEFGMTPAASTGHLLDSGCIDYSPTTERWQNEEKRFCIHNWYSIWNDFALRPQTDLVINLLSFSKAKMDFNSSSPISLREFKETNILQIRISSWKKPTKSF